MIADPSPRRHSFRPARSRSTSMSIAAPSNVQSTEPNKHGYRGFSLGRVHVQPRRVLRLRRVADRQARDVGRRVPEGAPARRRLAVLLRDRQLRRRHRHRQPLRHGRPVRGPLQRRLPQGRARPPGELRDVGHQDDLRGDARRLDERRASTRSPRRPRPARPSASSTARTARRSRAIASPPRGWSASRATSALRNDDNGHPVNRQFLDVPQDEPEKHPEPGFEDEISSFNLFAYLSRSQVTWNPSVVSVCGDSLYCPTTEEYILPDHPRQRPRRVVHPAVGRADLAGRGPRHRRGPGQGHDAGR